MSTFLIGYDLNKSGQDYTSLIDKIKQISGGTWAHVLDSTWIIKSNSTCVAIRDSLLQEMDNNDEILVIDISGDAAAWVLMTDVSNWVTQNL